MGGITDILVLPFYGQGHLFPCAELCKHLSSLNCRPFLIIPSYLSSSLPSDIHRNPLIQVVQIPVSDSDHGPHRPHHELEQGIQAFLSERYEDVDAPGPAFVVMDVLMCWSKEIFKKAKVPIVSFFTCGACSVAMLYAAWKGHVENVGPDETRILSGLPESMALSYSDTMRKRRQRPVPPSLDHGNGNGRRSGMGPLRWLEETEGSSALLINTCDDLEAPFLQFLSGQVEKPVFGVGPLLPKTFWESVVHGRDSRASVRAANYTEDEVIQWLDSKPGGSVIYVSFGSEVGPTLKEYEELADALVESKQSFIWVIQPGPPSFGIGAESESGGYGLEGKVGERGLIIRGWAPQLSILSHGSTGGFLSHCGWNSTVEAIGCGVPILCWPIRGDQFHDAKLVVEYLKVGRMVGNADDVSIMVKKADIMQGIEGVMGDEEVRGRAAALRGIFEAGYPSSSSSASLKDLLIHHQQQLITK